MNFRSRSINPNRGLPGNHRLYVTGINRLLCVFLFHQVSSKKSCNYQSCQYFCLFYCFIGQKAKRLKTTQSWINGTGAISGRLTSLALLRLRMFSAMYLMLSMACLISGDTTEKATTVLTLCTFPRSGVPGVSFSWRQGQGHLFPAPSSMEDNLLSPNSRQLREPPATCWRSHLKVKPSCDQLAKPEITLIRCGQGTKWTFRGQSVAKRHSSSKSQAPGAANVRDHGAGSADKLDFKSLSASESRQNCNYSHTINTSFWDRKWARTLRTHFDRSLARVCTGTRADRKSERAQDSSRCMSISCLQEIPLP